MPVFPLLILLVVAMLPLGTAAAQPAGSVALRVIVESEDAPLASARVIAGEVSGLTGATGEVTLRLPAGAIRLRVARIGFDPVERQLELHAGRDTTVTIVLRRGTPELDDLIVAVTRSARRLADQPTRVEVVDEDEIAEKVLMTPGDIAMLLNETGGLRVQNSSPSLGGANVRIQGLRGRYTLLLSDGLPLHGEPAGGPGLLQVPPMDLGQVEVVKGAASALHGGAALGGVVNLLSRRPSGERDLLANVTSSGGSDLVTWLSGVPAPEWGWSVYAGWHRQERRDLDGDGWTDLPGYRRGVIRPRVHHENRRGGTFFGTVGVTLEEREGGTLPGRVAPDGQPWTERNRSAKVDVGATARAVVSEGTFLSVRASAVTQRHRHRFGPAIEPDRHSTAFLEAAVVRGTGAMVVVAGAAWQGDWFRSEAVPRFDYQHSVPAGFAQLEWDLSSAVALAASTRVDHHNRYGTFLSPRVSLLGRPAPGVTARLAGGAGFFGPTPLVEATEVTGLAVLRQFDSLRAERVAGGAFDLTWHHGALELGGTVFLSRVSHPVATTPVIGGSAEELVLANQREPVSTRGAELLARVHRGGLHLTASYTWLDATEAPEGAARRPVPLNPRQALGVVGMYEWEDAGRIGVEVYAVGRQALEENPYRIESPSYLLAGVLAERSLGPARLFVNIENLTGVRQTRTDPLVRPTRGPGGRWTTDAWAPLEGRVVNGGARFRW